MWIASPGPTLCLDFANTLAWRGTAEPAEALTDLGSASAWIGETAGADARTASALNTWSQQHPGAAADVFAAVLTLREAMYRTFSARAAAKKPVAQDIALLNAALAEAPQRQALAKTASGFGWIVEPITTPTAAHLLAPVLWSAGDLLVRPDAQVRQCANEKCLWLFIDASRNGTRRWCDMSACGNRAKAARHYKKSKVSS